MVIIFQLFMFEKSQVQNKEQDLSKEIETYMYFNSINSFLCSIDC